MFDSQHDNVIVLDQIENPVAPNDDLANRLPPILRYHASEARESLESFRGSVDAAGETRGPKWRDERYAVTDGQKFCMSLY
jgi:hypothetical protein